MKFSARILTVLLLPAVVICQSSSELSASSDQLASYLEKFAGVKIKSLVVNIRITKELRASGEFKARITGTDPSTLEPLLEKADTHARIQNEKLAGRGVDISGLNYTVRGDTAIISGKASIQDLTLIPELISENDPFTVSIEKKGTSIHAVVKPKPVLMLVYPFIENLEINATLPSKATLTNATSMKGTTLTWKSSYSIPPLEAVFKP